MSNLKDLTFARQDELFASMGEKRFRADQLRQWLYQKRVCDFGLMTNLSKELREKLSAEHTADGLGTEARRVSKDGTIKYLFQLPDGMTVETVFIPEKTRGTVCLSTQVGCKFRCSFCATGAQGYQRDLMLGEILNQLIEVQNDPKTGEVTNIVYMGMGEPLDNFDTVVESAKILHDPKGFNLGARKITLSTAGVTPQLERLGKLDLNISIAISLHSANDEVRTKLMPINKKYPVAGLLKACRQYPLRPHRRITMEMVLFAGLNDSPDDAKRLIKSLHGIKAKVNLITFNRVEGTELKLTRRVGQLAFQKILNDAGIPTSIRTSKGEDIEAACGQLKSAFI